MNLRETLPATAHRVEAVTDASINARNRRRLRDSVARFEGLGSHAISERIDQLKREWDIERALEANAAAFSLMGLGLGVFHDRRWLALPVTVAAFLLQHALQGWCPPVPVMRRLGIRTQAEIQDEIDALRVLRGDFRPARDARGAVDQVVAGAAS